MVLLVLGSIFVFAIPLSAGYDEETHFVRAWEMAHLYFIPNEQVGAKLPFPALYWELSYRRQPIVEAVEPGFWSRYGSLSLEAHDYVYANVETRSVYSPILLLPQALTLRYLGLSLRLPALAVYYACRLAGLISYLVLSWLAVRLIPYGKWLLAMLILSPMALFQASTVSADTISNGIGFLFMGATLAVAVSQQITWKHWAALLGLIAVLFFAKVNLIFLALLPFLLIPPVKFKMKYGYALLMAGVLALLLVEVVGWNIVAYSKFTRALAGANPREQLLFIGAHPLLFIKIIAQDVWTNTPAYMQGWVGVYGYNYWPVPGLTYLLYPLAVICITWTGDPEARGLRGATQGKRFRLILASLFVVGYLLSIISLYVAFTPVKSLVVAGVQGRYFTTVMPLLFLALLGPWPLREGDPGGHPPEAPPFPRADGVLRSPGGAPKQAPPLKNFPYMAIALALVALLLYTAGLVLSYHVTCGSEYYRLGLCYQPQYKNWAPESISSPPISPTLSLTQEIVPACNGMTELSVWVNSRGTDPAAMTTLALRAPTEQKDLAHQTLRNKDMPQGGWVTVRFSPESRSKDQLYLLTLAGSSPDGIQVGYSEKSEYLKGKLFENGTAVGQDILFQYGCVAGIQRIWQGGGN
jgi:uncharacterized membrane protein